MQKIIVGILPQSRLKTNDNPYDDRYEFLDLYTKKIYECGAIPVGLIAYNNSIPNELLDKCDAFIIQGGNKFEKYHYETIAYALKYNKPLLGICLGMQAIGIFGNVYERLNYNYSEPLFSEMYKRLKEENNGTLLERIESPNIHGDIIVNYENIDEARHKNIIIDKESIIYDIFKSEELNVVSLHNYALKKVAKCFRKSAISEDGIIESIEYNDNNYFIVGVLWHPEWDIDNLLFKRLVEEGEKRIGK